MFDTPLLQFVDVRLLEGGLGVLEVRFDEDEDTRHFEIPLSREGLARLIRRCVDLRDQLAGPLVPPFVVHVKASYPDYEPHGSQQTEAYDAHLSFRTLELAERAAELIRGELGRMFPARLQRYFDVTIPAVPELTFSLWSGDVGDESCDPDEVFAWLRDELLIDADDFCEYVSDEYWQCIGAEVNSDGRRRYYPLDDDYDGPGLQYYEEVSAYYAEKAKEKAADV